LFPPFFFSSVNKKKKKKKKNTKTKKQKTNKTKQKNVWQRQFPFLEYLTTWLDLISMEWAFFAALHHLWTSS